MNSLKAQEHHAGAAWVERKFNEARKSTDTKPKMSDCDSGQMQYPAAFLMIGTTKKEEALSSWFSNR